MHVLRGPGAGGCLSVFAATPNAGLSETAQGVQLSVHICDSSWLFSLAELCGLP